MLQRCLVDEFDTTRSASTEGCSAGCGGRRSAEPQRRSARAAACHRRAEGAFNHRAEALRFLRTAEQHRLYALWAVALSMGLRRGEALGLEWEGVDLDEGRMTIEAT